MSPSENSAVVTASIAMMAAGATLFYAMKGATASTAAKEDAGEDTIVFDSGDTASREIDIPSIAPEMDDIPEEGEKAAESSVISESTAKTQATAEESNNKNKTKAKTATSSKAIVPANNKQRRRNLLAKSLPARLFRRRTARNALSKSTTDPQKPSVGRSIRRRFSRNSAVTTNK